MRNYFLALGLQRSTSALNLKKAVDSMPADQLAEENDLQSIIVNDQWRDQYQKAHLQYEAIAAAIAHPALHYAENSHSWDKRVVEFEPVQNTIEL